MFPTTGCVASSGRRCQIPAAATAIHHIDDAKVAGAPTFAEVWPRLHDFAGGAVWIGHTLGYDLAVFKRECDRANVPFPMPRTLDTALLAQVVEPNLPSHALRASRRGSGSRRGSPFGNRRRA